MAAPIESETLAATSAGTEAPEALTDAAIELAKTDEYTLPMMATPRAPPTWRVVSLTADPTPALSRGSEPMIDSVAGAMVRAMPVAMMTKAKNTGVYPAEGSTWVMTQRPVATVSRPAATTSLVPKRSASLALWGATAIITTAKGMMRTPAARAE